MFLGKSIKNQSNSYSQYGEDRIIDLMKHLYGIHKITYMDIGAHHPFKLNNTQLLYESGQTGVNIEPDPIQYKFFTKHRKNDINLNIGIHEKPGELVFYQFVSPEFNTFSPSAAGEIERKGIKKINEIPVQVDTYNNIVKKYLNDMPPDMISLDAEGIDEVVIRSIDYTKYAPKIICVETYAYGVGKKNYELIDEITQRGYKIHADTFVNTIFIKSDIKLLNG
jgi:FkbM family methyltransferase